MSENFKDRFQKAHAAAEADLKIKQEQAQREANQKLKDRTAEFNKLAEILKDVVLPVLVEAKEALTSDRVRVSLSDGTDFRNIGRFETPEVQFGLGDDVVKFAIYSHDRVSVLFPGKHSGDTWSDRAEEFGMSNVADVTSEKVANLVEHLIKQNKGLVPKYRY